MATPDPVRIDISAEDVIAALTEQRNVALNELARTTAALQALQRRLSNGATPPELHHERADGLPAASN